MAYLKKLSIPLLFSAAALLLHLATISRYGYFRDEFYYLACAEHLAFGYVDHPPLIALVARAALLLGESPFALRILPALASASTVFLVGILSSEMGAGRLGQALACAGALVSPVYLTLGNFLSMNAFEPPLWALSMLVLVQALGRDEKRRLLWLGPILGLGFLLKYSMLWLSGGLVLGLLLSSDRRLLLCREAWGAAAIAALLILPNVLWQVHHDFPTVEFMRNAQLYKNAQMSAGAFVREQLLLMHPLAAPIWLAGLVGMFARRDLVRYRPLGVAFLAILLLLLFSRGKPYYLAPAYPGLLAAGGLVLERWRALGAAAGALALAGGAVTAPLAVPVLPVETLIRYSSALGIEASSGERHLLGPLPQHFADMFGWPELTERVAEVWARIPAEERAETAIYATNYGEAGALAFLGRRYGLPQVISGNNNYFLWGPGEPPPRVLITVGESPEDVAKAFEDVRLEATHSHPLAMPYENDLPILVARRPRRPLDQIWRRTKRFL